MHWEQMDETRMMKSITIFTETTLVEVGMFFELRIQENESVEAKKNNGD